MPLDALQLSTPARTLRSAGSNPASAEAPRLPDGPGFGLDAFEATGQPLAEPLPEGVFQAAPAAGPAADAWRVGFDPTGPESPAAAEPPAPSESPQARRQREQLALVARRASAGRSPDGRCYHHVWRFLTWIGGYGEVLTRGIPASHSRYARQFADLVNRNPAAFGLRKLPLDNPYDAPMGALVVVRPGAPGTGHPVAGDIAVADGTGRFFNGGEMSYGGPGNFPPGNRHVLGIYVPA